MRKPRDYGAELKALEDKARELKTRKVQQLGELVILTGADALTVDELMAYCKQEFTGYKKPKVIEFRDSLPKSNIGKILRRELRDQDGQAA